MNLAIDSRPIAKDIFSAKDYSAIQRFGLEQRPLHRGIESACVKDADTLVIQLAKRTWFDGSEISGREWCDGLIRWFQAQPEVGGYWTSRIRKVTHSKSTIKLKFERLPETWRDLLNSPNWVPWSGEKKSGNFTITEAENGWTILSRMGQIGQLTLVNSPEENDELFEKGALDYSADTAIHFENIDPQCRRRDTGLIAGIIFSPTMDLEVQTYLEAALAQMNFPESICQHWARLRFNSHGRRIRKGHTVTLAYDRFYPNLEICEAVQGFLVDHGHQVRLVADDYYDPQARTDMKFVILRDNGPRGLHLFLALKRLAVRRHLLKEWNSVILELENGLVSAEAAMVRSRLFMPLFKVPSVHRARLEPLNPLLEVFP